ncbi:MAG: SDR family oxidoreductase [Pseudomonadales bacterium]|nr:SDR family oxidoreductase [Pseudomonadales bacterium]|tara:strand:- start:1350 stop:2162 length:813 start_codon:yes stop_codon:yes gene_type:complete
MLETFRLDGKCAVVTGSGRGLGRAMAVALAEAGAKVVIAARTESQIKETMEIIKDSGGTAIPSVTDVTDSGDVNAMVDLCVESFGRIDIMIANAGGGGVSGNWDFWEYPDEAFETVIATNLKSNFYCGRAAAKYMVEQGDGGVIVNTSSGTALRGNKSFAYPTAKGGQISLTKSMATILGPHNIRVNVIIPGFVAQQPAADERERALRERRGQNIPVRRIGEWWELGPLAVYLSSDASSYVTGQQFVIDGGGLAGGIGPSGFVPNTEGSQ